MDDRKFLNQHSHVLKSYLFSHIESFPLYLSKNLVNSNPPFNFTSEEFNSLVDKYRCIPKEKIKYESLALILKNRLLSKMGRYHVSNLKEELAKDFHTYVNYDFEVKFIPQEDLSNFEMIEGKLSYCCSYDVKWLSKYFDYSTILSNFIQIFIFIDINHRISFVSLPLYSKNSYLVKFGLIKQRVSEFGSYSTWESLFNLAVLKTSAYSKFLIGNNIYIEDVIDWFFSDYIKKEFSIDNFIVNIKAAKNLESYSDKIKLLLPEFESIFKQFEAYCEFNYVNHDYVSSSLSIGENSYPESLIKPEITYVEKNDSDDAKIIFNDLFHEDYRLNDTKIYSIF